MRIIEKSAETLRTDVIKQQPARVPGLGTGEPIQAILPVPRADRVQISDAGREMASRVETTAAKAPSAELTAERVSEMRRRVLEGAYNSLGMVDQVARRMLASGDIRPGERGSPTEPRRIPLAIGTREPGGVAG